MDGRSKVSVEMLVEYTPSIFLIEEAKYYLYNVIYDNKEEKLIFSKVKYSINEIFQQKNLVKQRQDILAYPIWYKQTKKKLLHTLVLV